MTRPLDACKFIFIDSPMLCPLKNNDLAMNTNRMRIQLLNYSFCRNQKRNDRITGDQTLQIVEFNLDATRIS